MALDRIALSGFRNHSDTQLRGTAKLNLLTGANGAGKTNILEALSLLAPGRGLRRARVEEMAHEDGENGFAIGASLIEQGGESARIGTLVETGPSTRRKVRINGAEASAAALAEWLAVSWLTPAMDGLFNDTAAARRRYLDRLTVALEPGHAQNTTRYEAAMRERNKLLTSETRVDGRWFDAIETQMSGYARALSRARTECINALNAGIIELEGTPFALPQLAIERRDETAPDADLAQIWRDTRHRDRAAQRTLAGPHRCDLAVTYAAKSMPAARCSTGEQKAMLVAITLAHADLSARGRPGILLLDEVAAHLDPDRREAMFALLRRGPAQVWMTGTEDAPFASLSDAARWTIADGAAHSSGDASPT